ncbi:uncharacterized protein I206_105435 [Kwoniella pini CBS 10737]|uniref:MPN domain-containing protein n=1 Tax=Kwoniella pini CBS 10737 TaxID=1296096 RepID=A0A1B9I496_9TREE|nr:uncharacterized protein I206_03659 [Kwoniella pini CBS 10737]OCF50340.1 hypothetical protein I206_03659 [Kwoniella pini CBS 10737]
MSNSYKYKLNSISYTIPILHSALHPSSTILGIFLASIPSSSSLSSEKEKEEEEKIIEIDEVIPLIHIYTNLSPITEIGLSLINEYCKLKNKKIVGIYLAKEFDDSITLNKTSEKILNVLKENFNGIFALVLNNDKLSKGQFAYIPYIPTSSNTFKPLTSLIDTIPESFSISNSNLPSKVIQIIRSKKIHKGLKDFDDNLEDSDADWLENKSVKEDIKKYLS